MVLFLPPQEAIFFYLVPRCLIQSNLKPLILTSFSNGSFFNIILVRFVRRRMR